VLYNSEGKAVRCVTGKKAEKAKIDVEQMAGYSLKQYPKDSCPVCNDKPKTDGQETKSGYCFSCNGWRFGLKYVNHNMIRYCRDCGSIYDLTNEKIVKGDNQK
jgi:hypothetical protein